MTTQATISNRQIRRGDGASPEVFTKIEEVLDISGFGANADLLDVTNFDSGANREYIGGKGDGVEFGVECNDFATATVQAALRGTTIGTTLNMQYAKTDQSPETVDNFAAVYLGFTEQPSPTEQNRITFNFKITGDIT